MFILDALNYPVNMEINELKCHCKDWMIMEKDRILAHADDIPNDAKNWHIYHECDLILVLQMNRGITRLFLKKNEEPTDTGTNDTKE